MIHNIIGLNIKNDHIYKLHTPGSRSFINPLKGKQYLHWSMSVRHFIFLFLSSKHKNSEGFKYGKCANANCGKEL